MILFTIVIKNSICFLGFQWICCTTTHHDLPQYRSRLHCSSLSATVMRFTNLSATMFSGTSVLQWCTPKYPKHCYCVLALLLLKENGLAWGSFSQQAFASLGARSVFESMGLIPVFTRKSKGAAAPDHDHIIPKGPNMSQPSAMIHDIQVTKLRCGAAARGLCPYGGPKGPWAILATEHAACRSPQLVLYSQDSEPKGAVFLRQLPQQLSIILSHLVPIVDRAVLRTCFNISRGDSRPLAHPVGSQSCPLGTEKIRKVSTLKTN